jgi:hypothetical protein
MADEDDDIDLEKVVWDPRYRRAVIERLNRNPVPRKTEPVPAPPAPRITIR